MGYSNFVYFLVEWHACAASMPMDNIILAQLSCPWMTPCFTYFSGLYYKPITIINDDSSVIDKLETSLIENARVVIYIHHMFIAQATGVCNLIMCINISAFSCYIFYFQIYFESW
jgi:hypothetical protein